MFTLQHDDFEWPDIPLLENFLLLHIREYLLVTTRSVRTNERDLKKEFLQTVTKLLLEEVQKSGFIFDANFFSFEEICEKVGSYYSMFDTDTHLDSDSESSSHLDSGIDSSSIPSFDRIHQNLLNTCVMSQNLQWDEDDDNPSSDPISSENIQDHPLWMLDHYSNKIEYSHQNDVCSFKATYDHGYSYSDIDGGEQKDLEQQSMSTTSTASDDNDQSKVKESYLEDYHSSSSTNVNKLMQHQQRKLEDAGFIMSEKKCKIYQHIYSSSMIAGDDSPRPKRVLAKIQRWCTSEKKGKWSTSSEIHDSGNAIILNLRRGGMLRILPSIVSNCELEKVRDEVLKSELFRQYSIQAQDEPRLNFLLHDEATEAFESAQPGYHYANVTIKARPLHKLPLVCNLSKHMAYLSGIDRWNIGVHIVFYRGNLDKMGRHADDDQGEEIILCLVVSSPPKPRQIIITPKVKTPDFVDGDEKIEITLMPGDAYEMNGEMQQHYYHSIPQHKSIEADRYSRMVIVFRKGDQVNFLNDTGRPCLNLSPREPKNQIFGRVDGIEEGHTYRRTELFDKCAHLMQQRGISGNFKHGCDAIIVSGLREDKLGCDNFFTLMYAAEANKGAPALVSSFFQCKPVRIFRSSNYDSQFKACGFERSKSQNFYRYDGLYAVIDVKAPDHFEEPYQFIFKRLEAGENVMLNKIQNGQFVSYCETIGSLKSQMNQPQSKYYLLGYFSHRAVPAIKM